MIVAQKPQMLNGLFLTTFKTHAFKLWVMQNHHLTSISTSIQKNARPIFLGTDPIWGAHVCSTNVRPLVSMCTFIKQPLYTVIRHYCVYTQDPKFATVLRFIKSYNIKHELHLNRTRFWIDDSSPTWCLLLLQFYAHIHSIDSESDHTLGV